MITVAMAVQYAAGAFLLGLLFGLAVTIRCQKKQEKYQNEVLSSMIKAEHNIGEAEE